MQQYEERKFARCVKQLGFYTLEIQTQNHFQFARCVKQLGFYTVFKPTEIVDVFARCVKQLGFYTNVGNNQSVVCLLGVLNN